MYAGLSPTYTTTNFFRELDKEWRLLTSTEMNHLESINIDAGGNAYRTLLFWCLSIIRTAYADGKIDKELSNQMREKVLVFRASAAVLYDFHDHPVPFFYLYFTNCLMVLYLPLFAASMGLTALNFDKVVPIVEIGLAGAVFLVASLTVGIRVCTSMISDPFADEIANHDVLSAVRDACYDSFDILTFPDLPPLDEQEEKTLRKKMRRKS